jgi:hypothetical protein
MYFQFIKEIKEVRGDRFFASVAKELRESKSMITGHATHPYDIHEILVVYQKIDPGYRLGP